MNIIAVDAHPVPKSDYVRELRLLDGLNDLMSRADVVVVATPITPETRGMIGPKQLGLMKKQGLVSITKNKNDSRVRDVKLTAKGAGKYKAAQAVLKKQLAQLQKLDSAKDRKTSEQVVNNLLSALTHDVATKRRLIR